MLKNKFHLYGDELTQLPAHLQYGKHMFQRIKAQKNKLAFINAETGETLSYEELTQKVVDIALSLTRMGIKKGDVVGVCSEKNLDFIATKLAIACAGATICPTDVSSGRANIIHRLKLANPKLMFCSAYGYDTHKESFSEIPGLNQFIVYGDKAREGATLFKDFLTEHAAVEDFQPVPVTAEDPVCILYSSGTTGLPKGIPLTNKSFLMWMESIINRNIFNDKKVLTTREWYYSYGLSFTLSCIAAGSTIVYCPSGDTPSFLDAIQACKVNVIQLAPATLTEMVNSPLIDQRDLNSTELIVSASTLCHGELIIAAKSKFPNLHKVCQLYGMSEVGGLASDQNAPKGIKYGSVGVVGPGLEVKVVDLETRVPLGPKQRGELCVKNIAYTPKYLTVTGSPTNHIDDDGFFITGDIVYYDEDGYIFWVDRIKELIKFDSYQVAPAELEAVLQQHPAVREAGVAGAPHPKYGEAPTALVVLKQGATISAEELVKYVDGQVSHRMRLAGGVRFVQQLPRNSADKLDRKALKLLL